MNFSTICEAVIIIVYGKNLLLKDVVHPVLYTKKAFQQESPFPE